jgi:TonB-dependent receptor
MAPHLYRSIRTGLFSLSVLLAAVAALAQSPATGIVEGRVSNPATGENIELVRITVEGTKLETFTDADGQYRLAGVPAGTVRVRAFRTGSVALTSPASVAASQVTKLNFEFASLGSSRPGADGTVKLEQFRVGASREMDGTAIAINTQRFAPNAMAVIAADEFGPVANGNAGELLKSVPGITLSLGSQGEMYQVAMNGVPPNNVPVTVGGFDLGNPAGGTTRGAGLHLLSLNNAARIEVAYTPTPDTPGSALAGTVNLVPRSAFERSRPVYNVSLGVLLRDNDRTFRKTPGPQHEPRRKVNPEVMLSAVVPLSPRLGFTLSASTSGIYTPQDFVQTTWRGVGGATNGGTLPHTTPDRPYLTDFLVRDRTAQPERRAFAATLDYKLTPRDVFSLAFQYGYSGATQSERTLTFLVNRVAPGNFSPTFTRGFAGAGEIRITNDTFDVAQRLMMPTLTYRHLGPVWRIESGAGFSHTNRKNRDLAKGFFRNSQARRQNVTVAFDDIFYLRPRTITVTDGTTGAPIDPYSINSYALNTATGNDSDSFALQRNLFATARRDFAGPVPFTLKAGLDLRQSIKDLRADNPTYTFVGADARASRVLDESLSERPGPFGFPRIGWVHNRELFDLFSASPASFTLNQAGRYQQAVATSKFADEIISGAFVRGDLALLGGRLKLVGGLRAEQTNAEGEGQLIDPTRNFQRDSAGHVILGANGRPLPRTADALEIARLTRIDRGLHAEKEYLRLFPSLNAAFNLTENLVARAGYYQSVGRPDLVQYAGSLTLPDTESPPGPANVIGANNAAIKAWQAQTFKAGVEYFMEPVGLVSVSVFRREIENFFGSTVFRPDAEFLALYGLNPAIYGAYDVATQFNLPGLARMTGVDVSYKQALTMLPHWARGVSVFANASAIRTTGDAAASFNGFTPRTYNWGLSLARDTHSVRLRWNYAGRARRGLVAAGGSIDPATYNWNSKRLLVDLNAEYRFTRRLAVFANLANLRDAPVDLEISNPSTPEHAQLRQRQQWGATWTFGVTGTF